MLYPYPSIQKYVTMSSARPVTDLGTHDVQRRRKLGGYRFLGNLGRRLVLNEAKKESIIILATNSLVTVEIEWPDKTGSVDGGTWSAARNTLHLTEATCRKACQ